MADDKTSANEAPAKKSKLGLIIGVVLGLITLVGGTVAGAVLGPQLLGTAPAAAEGEEGADGEGENAEEAETKKAASKNKAPELVDGEPAQIISVPLPAVIVDVRDEDGRTRHLKVALSAELMDESVVEEFPLVIPRGREAALGYLRSLTFEEIADPKKYNEIKENLTTKAIEALGKHRVYRILVTEFVAQ